MFVPDWDDHYSNQCSLEHSWLGIHADSNEYFTCCLLPVRDGREVPASDSWSWIVSVSCSNYIPSLKCVPVTQLSHGLEPCCLWMEEGVGRGGGKTLVLYFTSKRRLKVVATELNENTVASCRVSVLWVARKSSCEWEALTNARHATTALLKHRLYK